MTAGVPILRIAAARLPSLSTGANAVTGKPAPDRKVFSRIRFCTTCRTSPPGRTGAISSAARAVSPGTFSNSNVTTSTSRAKARTASRSS
jgi:hypothetical protein